MNTVEVIEANPNKMLADPVLLAQELGLNNSDGVQRAKRLILEAGSLLEANTGREFQKEKVKETLQGTGTTFLPLTRRPIKGVHEVRSEDGVIINDFKVLEGEQGTLYRKAGWRSLYGFRRSVINAVEHRYSPILMWIVTYTAGYTTFTVSENQNGEEEEEEENGDGDNQNNGALPDVPLALQRDIMDIAAFLHTRSKDAGIQSKRLGDAQVTYSEHTPSEFVSLRAINWS